MTRYLEPLHCTEILTKLNRSGSLVVLNHNVQMVLIGCISRPRGQKLGFQNAIFQNLFVLNYKTQSFHNFIYNII